MANPDKLKPFILNWEGGFSNNKNDLGGSTNKGITLTTFRHYYGENKTVNDLKNITPTQWDYIFINGFWNRCKADEIKNQSVANSIVDWVFTSGTHGIRIIQRHLGIDDDGIIGDKTLAKINSADPLKLFNEIRELKIDYINRICAERPRNKVFKAGWLRRINSLKYQG
jgi:lysozyme family protein